MSAKQRVYLVGGLPWVTRETVWQGEFYSDGEQGAEADLQQGINILDTARNL